MELWLMVLIVLGSFLLFLFMGIPVAFTMGGISLVLGYIFWGGPASIEGFILGSYGKVIEFSLTALPLYIFMAGILRYSDLADDLYETVYRWFGGIRGGLAAGTTLISTMFAAMVGIATVATATLGVTARPSMIKRGYDSKLVSGVILAGGTLGILIPPSVLMIVFATEANVSAGQLFFAGFIPGGIAALLFMLYALIRCYINPNLGPAIPKEERYTFREKLESLRGVILPALVMVIVLVSIFTGMATPTEAGAVGVVGSLMAAAINRKLTWDNFKKMLSMTIKLNGMIFWIIIGAVAYSRIVSVTGVGQGLANLITDLEINRWLVLIIMQIILFILGMFIDPTGILLITSPLFLPVILELDFNPIWYGILFIVNMCMAYMTPPFGFSLFVLKGVAPEISMKELYLSVVPFVLIYIAVIILIMLFPQLVLWLPDQLLQK